MAKGIAIVGTGGRGSVDLVGPSPHFAYAKRKAILAA